MAAEQALFRFLFFMRQMLLFFFSRMYLRRRALRRRRVGRRRERYHEIQRAAIFAVIAIIEFIQAQGGIDREVLANAVRTISRVYTRRGGILTPRWAIVHDRTPAFEIGCQVDLPSMVEEVPSGSPQRGRIQEHDPVFQEALFTLSARPSSPWRQLFVCQLVPVLSMRGEITGDLSVTQMLFQIRRLLLSKPKYKERLVRRPATSRSLVEATQEVLGLGECGASPYFTSHPVARREGAKSQQDNNVDDPVMELKKSGNLTQPSAGHCLRLGEKYKKSEEQAATQMSQTQEKHLFLSQAASPMFYPTAKVNIVARNLLGPTGHLHCRPGPLSSSHPITPVCLRTTTRPDESPRPSSRWVDKRSDQSGFPKSGRPFVQNRFRIRKVSSASASLHVDPGNLASFFDGPCSDNDGVFLSDKLKPVQGLVRCRDDIPLISLYQALGERPGGGYCPGANTQAVWSRGDLAGHRNLLGLIGGRVFHLPRSYRRPAHQFTHHFLQPDNRREPGVRGSD
ncbi:hypothetical protein Bbelb_203810 [Branchiostoma belcheri]|nr:hypothetical protein Bbelb_203810 [Branchiostoma belcheri]